MLNCSGKLFSIILVASLTGSALLIASHRTARADDTCLPGPKATTPRGSHWYYRVEAGTKRHCWYLGEERGKAAQAKAKPSSDVRPSDKPTQTSATGPLQPVVSNARAEFVDAAPARVPAPAASSPSPDAVSTHDAGQPADISKPAVVTRWPDPATSVQPQPASAAEITSKSTPQLQGEHSEPAPTVRTTSAPPPRATSYSMPMLLGGLAGALAFAGFLGFTVVKLGSLNRRVQIRRRPESIWDNADTGPSPPPWQTQKNADSAPSPRSGTLRTRQDIEAQSRDILELLSRASRGAAT